MDFLTNTMVLKHDSPLPMSDPLDALEETMESLRGWKREDTPEEQIQTMLDVLDNVSLHRS